MWLTHLDRARGRRRGPWQPAPLHAPAAAEPAPAAAEEDPRKAAVAAAIARAKAKKAARESLTAETEDK